MRRCYPWIAQHELVPLVGRLLDAGVPARGSFLDIDPERVERAVDVNYLGGVWCLQAFAPGLRGAAAAGDAHVVNLVSVAGTIAFAPAGAYAAAKHAQLAFSRSTAALLRSSGIRVHTVLPGFVETEGFPQRAKLRSPLLRFFVIEVDDVAKAVVRDPALDRLDEVQQRHDRRTLPPGRVASDDRVRRPPVFGAEHRHQRSTPPRTGSRLAITEITSATRPPSTICDTACRLTKEGSRIFTR